ncbi:hypothetical protein VNO77_36383 [Canavalia gladiata]|uniref:Uncharacterized protein n=1 Tax=Canavalia gladiata TaxID=3824 RepID=A0AAN9K982_CANGL
MSVQLFGGRIVIELNFLIKKIPASFCSQLTLHECGVILIENACVSVTISHGHASSQHQFNPLSSLNHPTPPPLPCFPRFYAIQFRKQKRSKRLCSVKAPNSTATVPVKFKSYYFHFRRDDSRRMWKPRPDRD